MGRAGFKQFVSKCQRHAGSARRFDLSEVLLDEESEQQY